MNFFDILPKDIQNLVTAYSQPLVLFRHINNDYQFIISTLYWQFSFIICDPLQQSNISKTELFKFLNDIFQGQNAGICLDQGNFQRDGKITKLIMVWRNGAFSFRGTNFDLTLNQELSLALLLRFQELTSFRFKVAQTDEVRNPAIGAIRDGSLLIINTGDLNTMIYESLATSETKVIKNENYLDYHLSDYNRLILGASILRQLGE